MNIILMCLIVLSGVHPQESSSLIKLTRAGTVTPQYLPDYDYISLTKYYFNPVKGLPEIPAELKATSNYYLIHLRGPVYEDMKNMIESYGVKLIQYIPFNAYIARMDESKIALIKDLPFVNWVGNYEPAYKISPLFDELKDEKRMLVLLFYDEDIHSVVNKLKNFGCEILEVSESEYNKIIKIETEHSNLIRIAHLPGVMYIEPWLEPVLLNNNAQWVTQTWRQQNRRIWRKGIYGQGQVVNTADSGILTSHDMFRDPAVTITTWEDYPTHRKIIAYRTWTGSSAAFGDNSSAGWHGTHTAGTICGDDSCVGGTNYNDGMPPKAKMYHMDIGTSTGNLSLPADLNNLYQPAILWQCWRCGEDFITILGYFSTRRFL